jgi:hypothetical protein
LGLPFDPEEYYQMTQFIDDSPGQKFSTVERTPEDKEFNKKVARGDSLKTDKKYL